MSDETPKNTQHDPSWVVGLQALLLLVLIAIRFAEPVGDGDLFWQMAYGKYMLEHHTLIPDHTIYSWTPADNPYIYCSWFAEISLYLMHQLGSLPLLFAFRYAMVIFTVALACQYASLLGWHRRAAFWFMLTWFVSASYVGSILKPELFSLGFMSLLAWLIFRFRLAANRGEPYYRYLIGMVAVMILWANTHGVFLFGLTAVGAYALGELFNMLLSPSLALPRQAQKPLLIAAVGCGLAAFCTPYGYAFVEQSVKELLSIVYQNQSAGDKAAYSSLAAHLPVWKALAFHFHEYLALGTVVGAVVCSWLLCRRTGKIDWPYLILNAWFGLIFTVYLRSTFYWPPFFLYSTLYLFHVLRTQPEYAPESAQRDSISDFLFVFANLAILCFYYSYVDVLSVYLRMEPAQAIKLLTLGGIALQSFVVACYTVWRVAFSDSHTSSETPEGLALPGPRKVGYLEPRYWLVMVALVSQTYLCFRNSKEAITVPYASSWFGFGITYWNPVDEVEFIKKYHPDIKAIINDYDSGGYLIWSLFPKTKVLIDPRSFPYRKFWADYIAYEHGQLGLEFLDRFKERPEVCIVSLKNQNLWRSYLKDPKNWVPAWVGTAYVVFVKRGFVYPPDAAQFRPGRFETLRNAQKALQIYQFGIESNLFETSWIVLDVMKRRFYSTPDEKRLVDNLEAFKESMVAVHAKKWDEAIAAQEKCVDYGLFVNGQLLVQLYKIKLAQLKQEGKKETDPECQKLFARAQQVLAALKQSPGP
ncbi:hypothetical protein IV102_18755 [bacterium]|nr:hypothetical protein [bacterium]